MAQRSRLAWPVTVLSVVWLFSSGVFAFGAEFNIASGDIAGLIAAINAANANGEPDTINLAPGRYTLTSIDNGGHGADNNGLPVIASVITINGSDAEITSIAAGANARLRPFEIATTGVLVINRISIAGHIDGPGGAFRNTGNLTINNSVIEGNAGSGGAIYNDGRLTLMQTTIRNAVTPLEAGAIRNNGSMTMVSSTVTHSSSENAIVDNWGEALIIDSTITNNSTFRAGSVSNAGRMIILGTTIARNEGFLKPAVDISGEAKIINSTIAENTRGGIEGGPTLELQNSIVARNEGGDCTGVIKSAGNNLVGESCDGIQLLPSDLIGDPGLDAFIDDGAPGHGRYPLLPNSAAIDRGNYSICSLEPSLATDQIGLPRRNACDIGSTEFFPIVNEALALTGINTSFDPTPVPGGPAGTFLINATFQNGSTQTIGQPFVQVTTLTGGNLLLNAEGGRGGVGAWLPLSGAGSSAQGASRTVQLRIGLQQAAPFNFFVNVLGDQ